MAGVLSLVVSNPSLEDYEAHAGDQLVALGTKELCDAPTLPMVVRLWIRNCPELIAAQRDALAALAGQFTTRRNLVVASLYSTRMGGKQLLPGLRLPGFDVLSLGVAGRFVILRTEASGGTEERQTSGHAKHSLALVPLRLGSPWGCSISSMQHPSPSSRSRG